MKTVKSRAYKDRLKGHKETILSLFSPDGPLGNILVSASADGIIRGWDLIGRSVRFKIQIEKPESKQDITSYHFSGSNLYVGFSEGEIRIFEMLNAKLLSVMRGHEKAITSLQIYDNKLISASLDSTVRVWNPKTAECDLIYQFSDPISDIKILKNTLILASWDKMLRVLDLQENTLKETIQALDQPIKCIDIYEGIIYVGGCDSVIKAWDLENNSCKEYKGHSSWILGMKNHGDHMYSCSDDRKIRVWDRNTQKCVEEFEGHEDGVTCLEFANGTLYSGSFDHSIRSWDLAEMYKRIQERQYMTREDILTRKIETYFRLLSAKKKGKKGKKGKGKGKGKGKKGKKK
ncbi:unnamed protein product [Blepharisma stoltei]|uniref:Uncharacterized protein n=1 Tax=Blepharisma stoltei TaxID=1481888 RepID=A0AAU9K9Q5_9CILI|nr:unnamed protein product [Blepharisma stoltei]